MQWITASVANYILLILYTTTALLPIKVYLIQGSPAVIGNNATVFMSLSKPASKPVVLQLWNSVTRKYADIPCKNAYKHYTIM